MNALNQTEKNNIRDHGSSDKFSVDDLTAFWRDAAAVTVPAVNIRDRKDTMFIEVALPGVDKHHLQLEVCGNSLHLCSSMKTATQQHEKFFTREFNYSDFSRSIPLPENTDSEKISASYSNGILNILVPRDVAAKTRSRTIKID